MNLKSLLKAGKKKIAAGETEVIGHEQTLVFLWMVYLNVVLVRKG